MNSQRKVKFLIALALLIMVTLFAVIVFQLVKIIKTNNQLERQSQQIEQLEEQLDYYKNKQPDSYYEIIS